MKHTPAALPFMRIGLAIVTVAASLIICSCTGDDPQPEPSPQDPGFISFIDQSTGDTISSADVFKTGTFMEIDIEDRGVPYLHEASKWFQTKFLFKKEKTGFVLVYVFEGCQDTGYEDCTASYKDLVEMEWCGQDEWWKWKDIVEYCYHPKFHFRIKSSQSPNDSTKDSKSIYYDCIHLYPDIGFNSISRNITGFYVNGYSLLDNIITIKAGPDYSRDDNYF